MLQAEALAPFLISVVLINILPFHFSWWIWVLVFLVPDLGMLGYLVNNRVGAIVYNIVHHQLVAALVIVAGFVLDQPYVSLTGAVLLGHSSLDRVMGFGLKQYAGFRFTHLQPYQPERSTKA